MNPIDDILGAPTSPNIEEVLGPSGAGAGRGFVNPPVVTTGRRGGTSRELAGRYGTNMAPGVQAETQPSAAPEAFLRSLGYGVTAGLSQYPAAVGIQATRALTGGSPMSFSEALDEVRSQNRQIREQYPITSGLGEVAGAGALTALTGGGGLAAQTGKAALQGGISGATAADTLEKAPAAAALGALTSAGLTGTLGGLGKLLGKTPEQETRLIKQYYIDRQLDAAEKYRQQGKELLVAAAPTLEKWQRTFGALRTPQDAERAMRTIQRLEVGTTDRSALYRAGITEAERQIVSDALKASSVAKNRMKNVLEAQRLRPEVAAEQPLIYEKVAGSLKTAPMSVVKEELGTLKRMAPDIALGSAIGAGGALALGQDPITGAAIGGGLGGLYDVRQRGLPRLFSTIPAAAIAAYPGITQRAMPAASTAGRIIGQEFARVLPQSEQPQAPVDINELETILGPIEQPQPQPAGLKGLLNRIKTEGFK